MTTINFSPFPALETERLTLRQITMHDAPEMWAIRSDNEVMRYLDRPKLKSLEDGQTWVQKVTDSLANNDGITWGLALRNEPKLIGTIGFWRLDKEHYRAEIGYMMFPKYQGQGIMKEALMAAVDYAFHQLGMHSIEANVNPGNQASIKLLERNGFVREAYFKENYYYDGKFLDSAIYSLVNFSA